MRRRALVAGVALVLAAGASVAGCGSSSSSKDVTVPTVRAATVGANGTVLVDGAGHALYLFVPDQRRAVTCTDACAGTWPPLFTPASGTAAAVAGAGVDASKVGADRSPAGGTVVTYGGWPLYYYAADLAGGEAAGQGVDLNGGYWYLLRPDGTPLVPPGDPAP